MEELDAWRPEIFDPGRREDAARLASLIDACQPIVHDTLDLQLAELAAARRPDRAHVVEGPRAIEEILGGLPGRRWVWFAWSRRLVHLLPPAELRELRLSRNQHKILRDEQRLLGEKSIAVAGLSVGAAAAITLLMEGIGRRFHLADPDTLGLSNLNRLRAGVHELGVPKARLAARRMFEIDPYLDVRLFEGGAREEDLCAFLDGVDLLVEECDDVAMKLRLREEARARRIPVVMETSDRGMLDVERFDLEPDRPILHGLTGGVRGVELARLGRDERLALVARIVDAERASDAAVASLLEVGRTLASWPQLASGVALGSGVLTDAARRILLGKLACSGRFYVDLEALVAPGAAATPASACRAPVEQAAPAPTAWAVGCAARALGNVPPCRLREDGDTIIGELVDDGSRLGLDGLAARLALGAVAENVSLVMGNMGLDARIASHPEGFVAHLARGGTPDPLGREVFRCAVDRRVAAPPLPAGAAAAIAGAAGGIDVRVVDDAGELRELARLAAKAERATWLDAELHAERAARIEGDGDDEPELSPVERIFLRAAARPGVAAILRGARGGRALGARVQAQVAGAAAVALLDVRGDAFLAGRALQRLWLTASALEVGVLPLWTPLVAARLGLVAGHERFGLGERLLVRLAGGARALATDATKERSEACVPR